MLRQYELVERVKSYDPDADELLINRAYVYAMLLHGEQKRDSGDPYFSHPVEVAGLLTEIKLDGDSIMTALLHDTVEDTEATLGDIRRMFGGEVARLVDGVTKLSHVELQSQQSYQAENFRKLVLALSEDIRVLLVKLADRLHNMRTLDHLSDPARRRLKAAETMEIYAPLAGRIGMRDWKEELEDLAFAELQPEARKSIKLRLVFLEAGGGDQVERIVAELRDTLREAGYAVEVTGRRKSPYSIWQKMQRKNIAMEQLADITAFRVIVDEPMRCYEVLGRLHERYRAVPGRFKDHLSNPKENGYRSLHTDLIGPEGRRIEVQIRTREMHEIAEHGVAAHWRYKEGVPGRVEGRQYEWVRHFLDILESAASPDEFLAHTKMQFFEDQVFCFTPKGDLKALPRDATPVDFAYAVHSEIGDCCAGARVNGRQVPLRTRLQNGDQVDIITAGSSRVTPEWERFVVTGKARARIRQLANLRERGEFIRLGRSILDAALREAGRGPDEDILEAIARERGLDGADDLLTRIGKGQVAARDVIDERHPEAPTEPGAGPAEEILLPTPCRDSEAQPAEPAIVTGLTPGVSTHFARCCHPIPGDRIVGIVTAGKGVTVHTSECPTLESFAATPERWVAIDWDREARAGHPAHVGRLRLTITNAPGTLARVSALIARNAGNISNLKFTSRDSDFFDMLVDVEVSDTQHLLGIVAELRAQPEIASVDRARR